MPRLVWMLVAVAAPAFAQKVVFSPGPCSMSCSEILDKGHLIHLTQPDHVEVFDREGMRMFQTIVRSPAGRSIGSILSAAIDSDETVAVTAARDVPRGYAGGVMLFSPSGERFRIIETGRFMPRHVTFDQNHYLWVFGWQWDEDDWVLEDRNDYPLVRNFPEVVARRAAFCCARHSQVGPMESICSRPQKIASGC